MDNMERGAAEELKRRRERGRLAQKQHRKRQAQAKEELLSQNRRLRQAVEALARATLVDDDKSNLTASVYEAMEAAGIDLDSLRNGTRGTLSPVRNTVWPDQGGSLVSRSVPRGLSRSELVLPPPPPPPRRHSQLHRHPGQCGQVSPMQPTRPRLLPDPFQYLATTAPPADMLPFLGRPGAYSFAGRIFWAVLERTMTAMDELAMLQPAAETEEAGQQQLAVVTLRPGAGFHRVVERMGGGGPSTTQHRITYLAAVHEARAAQGGCCCESSDGGGGGDATSALTAMNTGTTGSSVESSSQQWLSDLVAREYSYYGERGRRRAPMLSMTDIEHRVRKMLGEDAFAVVARATVEDWERGGGGGGGHHAAAGKNAGVVDGLLRRLTDTWVCFGEGPRWDVQLFETIMREWIATIAPGAIF